MTGPGGVTRGTPRTAACSGDDEVCPARPREVRVRVVEVEAIGLRVDFQSDPVADRGIDDRFDIHVVGLALQNDASGRVADDID